MAGEDGVLGDSPTGAKVWWSSSNSNNLGVAGRTGNDSLVGWGECLGAGLPCQLGMNCCFPKTLEALAEVSGSGVLSGRLRRSRSSLLLNRNNRFVLFR